MSVNPFDTGQSILDAYYSKLAFALESNQISPDSVNRILDGIQIRSPIYLSQNPRYARSDLEFANFVKQHHLPEALYDIFPIQRLYKHQERGILSILQNHHTIVSTGTGSGKTETFLIPIIAHCLKTGGAGVKALIIYPMNALAGDQIDRIEAYLDGTSLSFGLFTGATSERDRNHIRENPPDILVTNYVMLDYMLTRKKDYGIFGESAHSLKYVVLDELHTYSGTKATHLKYLLARLQYHLAPKPVFIGTSATLTSNVAGKQRLDQYVHDLYDLAENEDYAFVEIEEEAYPSPSESDIPVLTDDELETLDFTTDEVSVESIRRLTGIVTSTNDFYKRLEHFHLTPTFRGLERNPIISRLRQSLAQSAQSFDDLVAVVARALLTQHLSHTIPENLLLAYLELISFINEKAGDKGRKLLDYRVHIFIQNITGHLKMCPECQRYYVGDITHCNYDHHPLFATYKHEINICVGKFNGQQLTPVIEDESLDRKNVHYVKIRKFKDDDDLDFDLRGYITHDGQLHRDEQGDYQLAHLDIHSYDQLEAELIQLGETKHDYLYLYHLVKVTLQRYRKALSFVDNRELASRYSTIIRDELSSEFLYEFLRLFYRHERQHHLTRTLDWLKKKASTLGQSQLEQDVFQEIDTWYYRMISTPERAGGKQSLLKLRDEAFDWECLTPLERELLDIFICERAIAKPLIEEVEQMWHIRFQTFRATLKRAIFVEGGVSKDRDFSGISLGERGLEYADFIDKWSVTDIQNAVNLLLESEILTSEITQDHKTAYFLNPEYVCFNLEQSPYGEGEDGYERLRSDLLFNADVHTSELKTEKRLDIESRFKQGDIHLITATPTLEMGIDIGDLQSVIMIGVPPSPASYAQRAGRAGRGKNREALIITLCSTINTHDQYGFRNPQTVINGKVHPPSFKPQNTHVLKKHINAFVLRNHIANQSQLREFCGMLPDSYIRQIPELRHLFGDWFDYAEYINEFRETIEDLIIQSDANKTSIAQYCYRESIFPDYNFSRDNVVTIDADDKEPYRNAGSFERNNFVLTSRDIEQAFRLFIPQQSIYVAGDIYNVLNDGIFETLDDGARQFQCFYAVKERQFATRRKIKQHLAIKEYFSPAIPELTDVKGVIQIGYSPECKLSFRNHGISHTREKNDPEAPSINIGYDLIRDAFVMRFDQSICSDILRNSLIAVLVKQVNNFYGLAPDELGVMLSTSLKDDTDNNRVYALLYDRSGNNNLRLGEIRHDFYALIAAAYDDLTHCPCDTDGCYECIRSYNMQFVDETLSKDRALMFTGYILGHRKFEPTILPFIPTNRRADLTLSIEQKSNHFYIRADTGNVYSASIDIDQNTTLFNLLNQAIYSEHKHGMQTLHMVTKLDWLVDSLNKRSVKKGVDAFNRLQFSLLRFDHAEAVLSKA